MDDKDFGIGVHQLSKKHNYTSGRIKAKGFSIRNLIDGGFSVKELGVAPQAQIFLTIAIIEFITFNKTYDSSSAPGDFNFGASFLKNKSDAQVRTVGRTVVEVVQGWCWCWWRGLGVKWCGRGMEAASWR